MNVKYQYQFGMKRHMIIKQDHDGMLNHEMYTRNQPTQ